MAAKKKGNRRTQEEKKKPPAEEKEEVVEEEPVVENIHQIINRLTQEDGIQSSKNISKNNVINKKFADGIGIDRSYRPYYIQANENNNIIVTEPYLSTSSHNLCISTSMKYANKSGYH